MFFFTSQSPNWSDLVWPYSKLWFIHFLRGLWKNAWSGTSNWLFYFLSLFIEVTLKFQAVWINFEIIDPHFYISPIAMMRAHNLCENISKVRHSDVLLANMMNHTDTIQIESYNENDDYSWGRLNAWIWYQYAKHWQHIFLLTIF